MGFEILLFVLGITLLFMGILHLKHQSEELDKNDRFIRSMKGIGAGILFIVISVVYFFSKKNQELENLITPILSIFGVLSLVSGIAVLSSKKINEFFWRFFWRSTDSKLDRNRLAIALMILGLGLLFGSYVYSGI